MAPSLVGGKLWSKIWEAIHTCTHMHTHEINKFRTHPIHPHIGNAHTTQAPEECARAREGGLYL